MNHLMVRKQLLDGSSRGRIVGMLQNGGLTADELASKLGFTSAAVRAHIATMERDGILQRGGLRPGTTRPSQVFELTPEVEQLLSGAYLPLLIELVHQSVTRSDTRQFEDLMRSTGRGLAALLPRIAPDEPFDSRVTAVGGLLNKQFGSTMTVEKMNGHYVLKGHGCPLAALTANHPAVCLAIESLLGALLEAEVRECCDRALRPQCCFHVAAMAGS